MTPVKKEQLKKESMILGALVALGTAACYLSIKIPHTEALIDGRWAFGFVGFAILRYRGSALLLSCSLSIPHNSDIAFFTGFFGNMLYAVPCLVLIRSVHTRYLSKIKKIWVYGIGWFLLVMICYQAFITPVVWGVLASLAETPVWPMIIEGWRTQPYWVESILVGIVSASILGSYRSNERLYRNQKRLDHVNRILMAIRNVNKMIVSEHDPHKLIERVCVNLTETMGYVSASILLMEETGNRVTGMTFSGQPGCLDTIQEKKTLENIPPCIKQALSQSQILVIENTCSECLYRNKSPAYSKLIGKLMVAERLYGVISVLVDADYAFNAVDRELFAEVVDDLAFALNKIDNAKALQLANDIIERSPAVAFVWKNEEGWPVEFVSDNVERILGWTATEFTSGEKSYSEIVYPDDLDRVNREVTQSAENPSSKTVDHAPYRILHKNGSIRWVEDNTVIRRDNASEIFRYEGIILDITDRRHSEEALRNSEERLKQAQKMESIGNLAGGIAHDFNNILFPIFGYAELVMDRLPSNSHEYENVQEILKAAKRGRDLIRQILSFSRQSTQQKTPIRIQQILKEVLKLTRSTIPSNIEIIQDIRPNCGSVMADPIQIHQIAMNLITNAYHAVETSDGKIFVHLHEIEWKSDAVSTPSLGAGRYNVLRVIDTGCGIEPTVIDKIFEPYFTTKEKEKGTGLGLSVVYGIVRDHGGDIKVSSELGKGTTFEVYFPVIQKNGETIPVGKTEPLKIGNERILLVDDEKPIVHMLKAMLTNFGYQVTERTNSIEALETFQKNPDAFDVVITDMTMPNMTGAQLARELIRIKPDIPIIICTGFSEQINAEKAKSIGVKGFLMKPVVKSELAHMVRKVLDNPTSSTDGE